MDGLYVIWSGRYQGWLTGTATYSTALEDAKRLTRDEAIAACQTHMAGDGGYNWLPIYIKDLEAMRSRK